MRLAPDAVHNVESVWLTEGYKSKFPLFHKLFLRSVEKFGNNASGWAVVRSECYMRHKKAA